MIEIWQECASFQTTSQRLADQVRTIMKKEWFSDLEILDIHKKTQSQDSTITNTLSGVNQKQHIGNEPPNLENKYATVPSNLTETQSQEQQTNLENLKRIMNNVKITLPSLRNIEWRTLKTETNKINQIIPYISTNNITELIYARAKLVCEKIGVPPKSMKKPSKSGWEVRLETQIKKSSKTDQNGICGKRMEKITREKITVRLEEINQKVPAKEERLKSKTKQKGKTKQNWAFQNNERKFYQQLGGHETKRYQQPDAKESEQFWTKIWQLKKHNEKAEWINDMTRELKGLEEGSKAEIHIELLKKTLKRYQTGKRQAMMEYMDSGSRNSPPFTTD